MPLIKCPECGNEVSNKSKQCIHCGCPLQKNTICNINGREYQLSFVLDENLTEQQKMMQLNKITGIPEWRCKLLIYGFIKDDKIPEEMSITIEENNQPKCPTCGSTNIRKITVGQKLVGSIGFGLLSKTAKSQFKCNNCGYKW